MKIEAGSLDIDFDKEKRRLFVDGKEAKFSSRTVSDMKNVLFNRQFLNESNRNDILYRMYRGVGSERSEFRANRIRYDITVMEDYNLGGEFTKTFGHYHPIAEDGLAYPEIYEILYGKATYILQKPKEDGSFDVEVIKAKEGDKVIMTPNYGHFTINVGNDILIEANLVNSDFESYYKPVEEMGGAAVFLLRDGRIVVNSNYRNFSFRKIDAGKVKFLDDSKSIYDEFVSKPEDFAFLNKPSLLEKLL
ncbi:MAG: glucose-6-phosphate isomerase family protein [Candidatus Micrarchaeaceae archaeon]